MGVAGKIVLAVLVVAALVGLGTYLYKRYAPGPAPHQLTAAQTANLSTLFAAQNAAAAAAAAASTPATTSAGAAARTYTPLTSLDAPGNTITTTSTPAGVSACNTLCDSTPGCVATSYSNRAQSCALKAQVPGAVYDADKTLSVLATDLPTTLPSSIANGSSVAYGGVLVSPGGKAAMMLGATNGLTVYSLATGKAVFTTNTAGKGVAPAYLSMQNDNNFVLYDSKNTALWATGTNGGGGASGSSTFSLSDTGFTVGPSGSSPGPRYQASWTL